MTIQQGATKMMGALTPLAPSVSTDADTLAARKAGADALLADVSGVNLLATGATSLFVPTSGQRVIPGRVVVVTTAITGAQVTGPTWQVGTNGGSNDIVAAVPATALNVVGQSSTGTPILDGAKTAVNGDTISINIATATVGPSVHTGRVLLFGTIVPA